MTIADAAAAFIAAHRAHVRTDEWFLQSVLFHMFAPDDRLEHDSVACLTWEGALPFPSPRNGTAFVGQIDLGRFAAGEGGGGREGAQAMDVSEWTCKSSPVQCRREPGWRKG